MRVYICGQKIELRVRNKFCIYCVNVLISHDLSGLFLKKISKGILIFPTCEGVFLFANY